MSPIFCNREHCLHVVVLGKCYRALQATALAAVNNPVFARRAFERDGLHHASAGRPSVAGFYVYMFAPQALRTVIRIPVACYGCPTMFTDKIFNRTFKTHMPSVYVSAP